MIIITAFKRLPPSMYGLAIDFRVRWALEEAGLHYEARLLDAEELSSARYRALQPFGQLPVFVEDGLVLFQSGAIVLHIGERSEALLPADPAARARAVTWVFTAVNTMEAVILPLAEIDLAHANEESAKLRRPLAEQAVKRRLGQLAAWLGDREYLEDRFTVGDLMMTTVLDEIRHTDLLDAHPTLRAYKARCQARPAYGRALARQIAPYEVKAA
jgi:glutathione S-transferase